MNVDGAGTAGGHWLGPKGRRTGAGGGGVCGRPTSDVDQVPTQRSLPPLPPPCENIAGSTVNRQRATRTSPLVDRMTIILHLRSALDQWGVEFWGQNSQKKRYLV